MVPPIPGVAFSIAKAKILRENLDLKLRKIKGKRKLYDPDKDNNILDEKSCSKLFNSDFYMLLVSDLQAWKNKDVPSRVLDKGLDKGLFISQFAGEVLLRVVAENEGITDYESLFLTLDYNKHKEVMLELIRFIDFNNIFY